MSLVSSVRKWQELEQFSSNFSLYYELQFAPGKNIWSNYLQDHSYSVNIFNNSMSIIFQQFKTIQWIYSTIQCQLSSNNSGLFSEYIFNNQMSIIFEQFRKIQWIYSTIHCQLSSTIQDYSVNIFNNPLSPKYNVVYKIASILQARKK
jgi:hypothetical protein